MRRESITICLPLLGQLRGFDRELKRRSRGGHRGGLSAIGLTLLRKPASHHYWCTPLNCLTFAATGGEGAHFSFLAVDGRVDEQSPVVVTNPCPTDFRHFIVGKNLNDFLCLGLRRGYFAMEQ